MARIKLSTPDSIVFQDTSCAADKPDAAGELVVQLGDWDTTSGPQAGIVFDVTGLSAPLLSAYDVRKLAKWLSNSADVLEGKTDKRQKKKRRRLEEEDDEFDGWAQ